MRQAACAVILSSDGYVLSISRKEDPSDIGLPGGKLEPEETFEEACTREVEEETGIRIGAMIKIYEGVCESPSGEPFLTACFLATKYNSGTIPKEGEGHVAWVTWNDLLNPSMTFSNYNCRVFGALRQYREKSGNS